MRCAVLFRRTACFTALAIAPAIAQETTGVSDSLAGIWVSETTFGAPLQGELTVARDGTSWRATLGGSEARFQLDGESVRFTFPRGLGGYRGMLTETGVIRGFWLQSPGEIADLATSQPFASPLVLQRSGSDVWHATVRPLENRYTLYLRIFPDEKGSLMAAFRNHEMNSRGGASQFRMTVDGDTVRFSARPDTTRPAIVHVATLAGSGDKLRIFWPDLDRVLELTRRSPEEASGFFPRPPHESYAYHQPPQTGDGWVTARAEDVDMDEAALTRLVQRLIDADPAARRPSLLHSLLVARHGKLVLEEYFFGYDRDTPHDIRSAGKTFASVMLGALMMRGYEVSPETPIYEVLSRLGPFANPDPRKSRITLAHLMTHTAGLACDDNDETSPGNEGTMSMQRRQPDWWKYTLDLPMAHEPGSRYAYCSANMNLVGAALTAKSGTWLPELFDSTIARPLQFESYHWNLIPTGEGYLGGGAFVRPRDLLKVGQAYLDGGVWRGQRIVDESWVTRSTAAQVEITPATTGLDSLTFPEFYGIGTDGYAWHLSHEHAGEYAATGNGGQVLIVMPAFDMVVVFTGGNYLQGGIWGRWRDEIVGGEIIPAIRSR